MRPPTEDQLREYAAEHLKYDALMLRATQVLLNKPNLPESLAHSLLESLMLATRRLMEFFYQESGGDNDARATQYCKSGDWTTTKPKALWKVTGRINREIAHASLERVNLTTETRGWDTGQMRQALEATFKEFVSLAYPDLLPARTKEVLLEDGYETDTHRAVTSSMTATNVAVSPIWTSSLRGSLLGKSLLGETGLMGARVEADLKYTSTRVLTPAEIANIHFPSLEDK
jgi:hypothetical protein